MLHSIHLSTCVSSEKILKVIGPCLLDDGSCPFCQWLICSGIKVVSIGRVRSFVLGAGMSIKLRQSHYFANQSSYLIWGTIESLSRKRWFLILLAAPWFFITVPFYCPLPESLEWASALCLLCELLLSLILLFVSCEFGSLVSSSFSWSSSYLVMVRRSLAVLSLGSLFRGRTRIDCFLFINFYLWDLWDVVLLPRWFMKQVSSYLIVPSASSVGFL